MRAFISMMFVVSAAFAVAGTASAAGKTEMSDMTYLAVAHCAGVAEGTGGDVAPFTSVLSAEAGARNADILDQADQTRDQARKVSSHAGPDGKAGYLRERDGVCRSYLQN